MPQFKTTPTKNNVHNRCGTLSRNCWNNFWTRLFVVVIELVAGDDNASSVVVSLFSCDCPSASFAVAVVASCVSSSSSSSSMNDANDEDRLLEDLEGDINHDDRALNGILRENMGGFVAAAAAAVVNSCCCSSCFWLLLSSSLLSFFSLL